MRREIAEPWPVDMDEVRREIAAGESAAKPGGAAGGEAHPA